MQKIKTNSLINNIKNDNLFTYQCIGCKQFFKPSYKIELGNLPYYYGLKNSKVENRIKGKLFPAKLVSCAFCGLTQQILFEDTLKVTDFIYKSQTAAVSSPMSDNGWGHTRTKEFFNKINFIKPPISVLEVGCQNGYLLYELFKRGAKYLIGRGYLS